MIGKNTAHYHMVGVIIGVVSEAVYVFDFNLISQGGHHVARADAESCVGFGGIAFLGRRRLLLDDFSMGCEMALGTIGN